MRPFLLKSCWHLDTSADAAWQLLADLESWPRWWRYVRQVDVVHRAAQRPLGDVADIRWGSALGYGLTLRVTTTAAERPRRLEGRADGDLRGSGCWTLTDDPAGGVEVAYRWRVRLRRRWMQRLAFALRPAFEWNHFVVMRAGGAGMARALGCRMSRLRELSGDAAVGPPAAPAARR